VTLFFSSAGGPHHKLTYVLWATNLHRCKVVVLACVQSMYYNCTYR